MRSTRWRLLIGAAVLAVAALAAGCAEQPAEEHDHSTHSHDEADSGSSGESTSMSSSAHESGDGGHVMVAAVEAPEGMSVELHVEPDAVDGYNIRVTTVGFTFTPQSANAEHVPGEGHAHLYVDGVQVTRLYGPAYHLTGVEPGEREIRVSLNTNAHADYVRGTRLVDAVQSVAAPEPGEGRGHMHPGPDTLEAPDGMAVAIHVEPDVHGGGGVNVRIDPTGFAFTPESVNGDHVAGEGHAHIYVDGEKISRVYGPWFFLGGLTPGEHEVRVTLNANTHQGYARNGEPLAATTTVTVE